MEFKPTTTDPKEIITLEDKDYLLIKAIQELGKNIERLTAVLNK